MKSNHKFLIGFVFLILYWIFNNQIPTSSLKGAYINTNFENSMFSEREDTLKLFGENEYFSPLHGYGKYEVEHTSEGTKLKLTGSFNFNTFVYRNWKGKPCIRMFDDLNHHYLKISSNEEVDRNKIERYLMFEKNMHEEMEKEMEKIQRERYDNPSSNDLRY